MEEKLITGCERYSITNNGIIKNNKTGRILKNYLDGAGYRAIEIVTNEKKPKQFLVHRLVAMMFMENFDSSLDINHIDGDRQNNNINNLECLTKSENTKHSYNRRKNSNGNVSKKKIMKLFRCRKYENAEDFLREILKF